MAADEERETEKWRETEAEGLAIEVRVALSVKHVLENMDIFVHPDDSIAGTWTENRLGVPLDIERGLFNEVMEIELGWLSMLRSLLASNLRFAAYAVRRHGIMGLYRSLKYTSEVGAAMPSTGLQPVNKRKVNPYRISPADRKLLQRTLLPYWKGRNVVDVLQKELAGSGLYQGDMLSFSAALPSTNSRNEIMLSPGAALGVWQGHVIIDHEKYLCMGVAAMLEEVRRAIESGRDLTAGQEASLRSQAIALEGGADLCREAPAETLGGARERAGRGARARPRRDARELHPCSGPPCHDIPRGGPVVLDGEERRGPVPAFQRQLPRAAGPGLLPLL